MSADQTSEPVKTALTSSRQACAPAAVTCFSILADCEPSVMPRVLELFAKRNLVPRRWVSDVCGSGGSELSIDLQVEGLETVTADYIARCLRALPTVERVLTSQKATI